MDAPLIKLIKPGNFTSVEGIKVSFSMADLESAVAAYDPAADPAPMVIGHPKLTAPAYGWAKSLRVEDGHLVAEPDQDKLDPAFAEAVNKGRFPKVSAQFYLPDSPHNPKPGHLYLKHIGFLGGAAPAVKGLGMVHFSESDAAETVEIEQPNTSGANQETQMTDKTKEQEVSFAEREATLKQREEQLAERETAAADREKAALAIQHDGNVSFAEGLVTAGKLAPAAKDLVIGLLDQLGQAPRVEAVSFGEAAADVEPAAALRKLLEGAVPLVSFGEAAKPEEEKKKATVSFAAPPGYEPDPKSLELYGKALELQAANPNLSFMDAVKQAGG
jgi:hypothetical protein